MKQQLENMSQPTPMRMSCGEIIPGVCRMQNTGCECSRYQSVMDACFQACQQRSPDCTASGASATRSSTARRCCDSPFPKMEQMPPVASTTSASSLQLYRTVHIRQYSFIKVLHTSWQAGKAIQRVSTRGLHIHRPGIENAHQGS